MRQVEIKRRKRKDRCISSKYVYVGGCAKSRKNVCMTMMYVVMIRNKIE